MPGGADFHTVNYWAEGTGGYSPYAPEAPVLGFALKLSPPASGTVFTFGQPVFLEVSAAEPRQDRASTFRPRCSTRRPASSSCWCSDAPAAPHPDSPKPSPSSRSCSAAFDLDPRTADTLPDGQVLRNNVNLTFGSSGFAFAEPGEYDVTPLLSFMMKDANGNPIDRIIRGDAIRIRVAHPHDMDQERDATTLFRADVGAWFALGGSDSLAKAGDALEEVKERRARARRRRPRGGGDHPSRRPACVATLYPVRRTPFNRPRPTPSRRPELLGSLDQAALATFDKHTAASTEQLVERLGRQLA